ncbi:transcriptional regulator [Pilimelia terevasa]|uniref:Transcriptional regulator n=1 Tax=Pilimelia terevasa TaxID=53372 RepID=A0A8J3BUV4_9ACTN|nr:LuxR C-terminal-related transcriptional regulator [Pilimelia terevasa]GGK42015.1 transcriptional regulator [Pilimelia terevasa]
MTSTLPLSIPFTDRLEPAAELTMAGGQPVLPSKFAVPGPPRLPVARIRLAERLGRCVRNPVTVVTGPAGSGKTEAVAAWVRAGAGGHPAAWVTFEQEDDHPVVFWTYLVESLRRSGLTLRRTPMDLVGTAHGQPTAMARLAADLSGQPRPVTLVLDGACTVPGSTWADELDFLVRHAAGLLRLVLIGRSDPPLPLHRYRVAGTLSEVRGGDLAFTGPEAGELLARHGIALAPDGLADAVRRTEGWAVGLRLFAMAWQGRPGADGAPPTLRGDEAGVAEYFVREVLRAQGRDVRDFLLRTSILETVTPELARLLTDRPDAQRLLAELARQNAFVEVVTEQPPAYRYHGLFAELLRTVLAGDQPGRVPELHRRAAGRLAADGRPLDAVGHAVAAGDWDAAADLAVESCAVLRLLTGGPGDRLADLFRDLPADAPGPAAALTAAALAYARAETDAAADRLAAAERSMTGTGATPSRRICAAALHGLLARAAGDAPGMQAAAGRMRVLLAELSPAARERREEVRAFALLLTGTAQSWTGAADEAAATLTDAAAAAGAWPALRPGCLRDLALLHAHRGHLSRAAALVDEAAGLPADTAAPTPPDAADDGAATAEVVRAWVATERYDVERGWRHLRAAEPLCRAPRAGAAAAAAALVRSRLLRARGEPREALAALAGLGGSAVPQWARREAALSRARILAAAGRGDEAAATVAGLPGPELPDCAVVRAGALRVGGDRDGARRLAAAAVDVAGAVVPVRLDGWLTLAGLAADDGDAEAASGALRRALRLAEPEALRRQLHEAGPQLRRLMRDGVPAGRRGAPAADRARPARAPRPRAAPVEKLSGRELEVLRHVEAMLPTEEIAGALYVSVNTVKTHVRSILRKLSASRRTEAVRRARELGLL